MTPMISVETLWKDYIAFEQSINPIIAEKMSMERSRDYMNARRVAKEHEAITRGLNRNFPSVPPNGSAEETKQVRCGPMRMQTHCKTMRIDKLHRQSSMAGAFVEKVH